uniref:SRCR domain-containing protein n=1 Tax=Elaeophora elaphi TaxID=1147741 RepID=A0A0R3RII9_9BILA
LNFQVLIPHKDIILNKLNVTQNHGYGLSLWLSNSQGSGGNSANVLGMMNIVPYNARGLLDICAAQKKFEVINRIIMFYKYDSYTVDCVKIFTSAERSIGFRFLLINLYDGSQMNLGRLDSITLYSDAKFTQRIHQFTSKTSDWSLNIQAQSLLAIHMRANAANGTTDKVLIRHSRIEQNDRGAIIYRNTGEIGPNLAISNCFIQKNGYHLFGNISTTTYTVQLYLHNTLLAQFRNNLLMDNIGGLWMTALTTSPIARLIVIIRECAFMHNSNGTILTFLGNGNQKLWLFNNLIRSNYALHHDTLLLKGITANLTRNLFANNTGLHNLDLRPNLPDSLDSYVLYKNWFYNNVALGHGYQYQERYGYQPNYLSDVHRSKREIVMEEGVSFDWWTHIGTDTERYRSTVYAGVSDVLYRENVFDNPINPYELVTGKTNSLEGRAIDARENYWGYPGTIGVASGKIRDYLDYEYLIRVDYVPVLESNASLIEGDCPAGWFQIGRGEFRSCFLYSGAATTYMTAVKFCQAMDAFVPYLRVDDSRQKELAKRIDDIIHMRASDSIDRYDTFTDAYDKQVWISGVTVPLTQCGWLSTRTGNIGTQNCHNLLSFVCEKGVLSYDEPTLWRSGIIIAIIALSILLVIIILLAVCWYRKSRKRKEEEVSRKECIRASLRLSKLANELRKNDGGNRIITNMTTAGTLNGTDLQTDDAIMNAHRNLVHGKDNNSWLTLTKPELSSEIYSGSNSVTSFVDQSIKYRPSAVEISKINSTVDSSCSGNTTESFAYHMPSSASRNLVSQKPNPYAEVSLNVFNAYGSINSRMGSSNDRSVNDRHNTESTCSTNTDTVTCSTCQDCGESTLTERSSWNDSSSAQSSIISDRTIQQLVKPLLNRAEQLTAKSVTEEDALHLVPKTFDSRSRSTYSKLTDLPPPPLFDPKLLENHGTSSVTSDEINGETPLRPIRAAPPPPPTSHCIATSADERLVPLEIPTISTPPRRSLYETTTELVRNKPYSSSSSYRTKIRPSVPPPNPPDYGYMRNPQSSQSLVDLITPSLHYQRSNSTGKALPIETSM